MSAKIDQFCENLKTQLNSIEGYLNKVGENIKSAPQQATDAVQSSYAAAKDQHNKNMAKVADAKAKFETQWNAKKEEVESQIEEWKTNREVDKLETRAVRAEDYAVAAMEFAAACVEEADTAALEAIVARIDAEEAKSAAT